VSDELIFEVFVTDACSHMGFEELAMRNINAVLKGQEPLTPVNKHLMVGRPKATL
jgi:hypothetical protein